MSSDEARDIVLFLGAGFSKHAGIPMMADFGSASKRMLEGLPQLEPKPRDLGKFMEAGKVFEAFQGYCQTAEAFVGAHVDNLESVFCIAESLAQAGERRLTLDGQSYAVPYILARIRGWLWKLYQQCPPLNKPELGVSYAHFVNILKKAVPRVAVLTTNYDLVFEYFAWKHKLPISYPLEYYLDNEEDNLLPKEHWNGFGKAEVADDLDQYVELNSSGSSVSICKLHGSVNFFEAPIGQGRFMLRVSGGILPAHTQVGQSKLTSEAPAILPLDALWALRAKYGDEITPGIISPTYAKLEPRLWLRYMWQEAVSALRRARAIVFIGYSMPPSDGFMLAMIRAALAERSTDQALSVLVIDPCRETLKRYQQLFAPLELQIGQQLHERPFENSLKILQDYFDKVPAQGH